MMNRYRIERIISYFLMISS